MENKMEIVNERIQQIGDLTYESVSHEEIIEKLKKILSIAITNIHEYGKQPRLLFEKSKWVNVSTRRNLTTSTPQGISCYNCVGNVEIDIKNVRDLDPLYKKFARSLGLKFGENNEIEGDLVNFIEKELGFVAHEKRALKDCYRDHRDPDPYRMYRVPLISYFEKVGTIETMIDLYKEHENLRDELGPFSYKGHLVKRTIINFPGLKRK